MQANGCSHAGFIVSKVDGQAWVSNGSDNKG